MENKISVLAIIINDYESVEIVNGILHSFRQYVLGRMGLPIKEKNLSVISIVLDAPQEIVNNISGKLGMVKGVSSKVLTTK